MPHHIEYGNFSTVPYFSLEAMKTLVDLNDVKNEIDRSVENIVMENFDRLVKDHWENEDLSENRQRQPYGRNSSLKHIHHFELILLIKEVTMVQL